MSEEVKTAENIAQDFTAMGHSVTLITDVIAGNAMADEEATDKQSAVDAAIVAGKAYTA